VFTHLTDLAKALTFYGIVVTLAIALTFVPLDGGTIAAASMFIPMFVVLLMLLVVTRDGHSAEGWASLGLHRLGIKGWPLAVFVAVAVLGAAYAFVWATGIAAYKDPGLDASGWAAGLGQGILGNLVFATLTFSLAEEIGWRGYLLPKLAAILASLTVATSPVATEFLAGESGVLIILGYGIRRGLAAAPPADTRDWVCRTGPGCARARSPLTGLLSIPTVTRCSQAPSHRTDVEAS